MIASKIFEIQTEFDNLHVICCKCFQSHIEKMSKERLFVTEKENKQTNKQKTLQHLLLYHFNFFKLKFSLSQLYDSNQQGLLLALQATLFSLQWNYFQSEHN